MDISAHSVDRVLDLIRHPDAQVRRWKSGKSERHENQAGPGGAAGERPRRRSPFRARGAPSAKKPPASAWTGIAVLPCERFEDLFRGVKEGAPAGAVVPIEIRWRVGARELRPPGEFRAAHRGRNQCAHRAHLIALKGVPFFRIKRYFPSVALNQCLDFFARNPRDRENSLLRHRRKRQMIAEEKLTDAAAIVPRCAEIYGGHILRRSIGRRTAGISPVFLLRTPEYARRHPIKVDRRAPLKTSLVFSTRNVPGRCSAR